MSGQVLNHGFKTHITDRDTLILTETHKLDTNVQDTDSPTDTLILKETQHKCSTTVQDTHDRQP